MERHRRIAVAFLAAAFLLASCSDDGAREASAEDIERIDDAEPETDPEVEPEPEPEPVEEPKPEPELAEVDITVVPDQITEEYVDAVFRELELHYAEALEELRRNDGEMNIEVTDRLGEIFDNEDALRQNIEIFQAAAADDFSGIREADALGPRDRLTLRIISSSAECIYAETSVDPSPIVLQPEGEIVNFVQLRPKIVERPVVLNRSSWVFARVTTPLDPADRDDIAENDPCVA
jgi:PBP1b-binding outer membrane lipoprotein LpoB